MANDLSTKQQGGGLSTVKGWLAEPAFQDAIAKALPKHMTADRFIRIATTACLTTPKLMQCSQESLIQALLKLSQYGLEPDGRRAHLIPFEDKKRGRTDVQLIIDYKGLAELVMRSGLVSNIHADVVCENDDFKYDRGQIERHVIDFRNPRGEAYAAYATVRLKDGTEKTEVLPKEDIYAIRNGSQGWYAFTQGWAKQSPWNPEHPHIEREMWKKTAFRRLSKWLPLSPEIRDAFADEDKAEEVIRDATATVVTVPPGQSQSDALANLLNQQAEENHDVRDTNDPPADATPPENATEETPPEDPDVEVFEPTDRYKSRAAAMNSDAELDKLLAEAEGHPQIKVIKVIIKDRKAAIAKFKSNQGGNLPLE